MDLSPETWVGIILLATVVGGGIMFWGTTPRKKKKLHLVNNARKRPGSERAKRR